MSDDVRAIARRLCQGKRPDEYLLLNPTTKRPYKDFKKGFGAACAEAGITNFTWKALRHTFATRLGEAGYTAGVIADLLGHGDVRTTMRYTHSTDRRKHEAVQSTMLSRRATA
jgi:integrase